MTCYVPEPARPGNAPLGKDRFCYDPERDVYICPAGNTLKWSRYHQQRRAHFYTAKVSDCRDCPLKAACTTAKRRSVSRLVNEPARAATVRAGPRYEHLQRRRWVNEHLNMLGKRDHALSRAHGLGLAAMRIQVALVAVAIDLNKLVRHVCTPPACVPGLRCALRAALTGLVRTLGALPATVRTMHTILRGQTGGPQPAANRGF